MLIVCAGMQRSGSTLQYNMARSLAEEMLVGCGEGFFERPESPELQKKFRMWGEDQALHVIKSHRLPFEAEEMSKSGTMRICYIYRDIRDVAVSLKHKTGKTVADLRNTLKNVTQTYYKLKNVEPVLWQKYENVVGDIPGAVYELAGFIGLQVTQELVELVADQCSVKRAQKITEGLRSRLSCKAYSALLRIGVPGSLARKLPFSQPYEKRTLLNPRHISKNFGAKGVWQSGLTEEELNIVLADHGPWLKDSGYSGHNE